jgi:hypothetical protein
MRCLTANGAEVWAYGMPQTDRLRFSETDNNTRTHSVGSPWTR